MPAKVGVEADVPLIRAAWPWNEIRKLADCAETSG
jgi:hypothetical protein